MHVRFAAALLALCCPALDAAAPPARLTPAQQKTRQQRDRLHAQFMRLGRGGEREEAGKLYRKVVELERQIYGDLSGQVFQRLRTVVILQEGRGEYRAALATRREMARILERLYGKDDHRAVDARWEVATALKRLDLSDEEIEQHRELFRLNARTRTLYRQGRPDAALPWATKYLDLSVKLWGEKHPQTIHATNNVGSLCMDLGDFARARRHFDDAGRLYREVLGERHPNYAAYLNNLATLHEAMRDGRGAVELAERAVRIFRLSEGGYSTSHAISLNTLAVLVLRQGDIRRARDLLEKSVEIRDVLGIDEMEAIPAVYNLGLIYSRLGDHEKAAELHERGLELSRRYLGGEHPRHAFGMNHLAMLYLDRGRHAAAYRLAMRAHDIRSAVLTARHPDMAHSNRDLARIDLAQGRLDRAAVRAGQALSISFRHAEGAVSGLSGRQRLNYIDEMSSSLDLYLTAARGRVPAGAQYEWVTRYKGLLPALAAEERLGQDDPRVGKLFDQLRQARGQLAQLAGESPAPAAAERWRQAFDQAERRKEDLQVQLAQASTGYAKLRQRPTARAVLAALPKDSALVEFVATVRGHGPRSARRELLAFVLRTGRDPVRVELGELGNVAALVRAWREPIETSGEPDAAVAAELRRRLWQPLDRHLAGVRTVLIAPDDELYRLPFAALPGRKAGTFLIEDHAVVTVNSGRQLLLPAAAAPGKVEGLLVLGGLDYGRSRRSADPLARPTEWAALPGTEVEADRVAKTYAAAFRGAASRRLAGGDATRSGVLARMQARPRWLHLATHGYYDSVSIPIDPARGAVCVGVAAQPGLAALTGLLSAALVDERGTTLARGMELAEQSDRTFGRNPMLLTSLVLSRVNQSGDEGYLTAEEIAALDLRGCELAVLSACETGLGRVAAWQGVQGLQQGFHQAGVGTVVASLWSVNDAATSVLMEEFYDQLWAKKVPPLEAMRQAQLAVLRDPDRVRKRAGELRDLLAKRGLPESALAKRGLSKRPVEVPLTPAKKKRAPVAWWGAWVVSGAPR